MIERFRDRTEGGQRLASLLRRYAGRDDVIVLALPRGGLPVANEVARALDAPLDVFIVRKLGVPWQEELAMGALASGGIRFVNQEVVDMYGIGAEDVERATGEQQVELERREKLYRGDRPPPDLAGKTVILVDDGLATGSSMRAAVNAVRTQRPAAVVVAVPVAAPETCELFRTIADDVVCAMTPEPFQAVGLWYQDFTQTTDDEVREILGESRLRALRP